MREVTFGITSFERPHLLQNLVRSIYLRYPLAKIVVADNGKQRAALPNSVTRLELPFDCGLSRARNALVDTLSTKYLLVLEDDFLFTEETSVEPLLDVLESDQEVGVVGGALRSFYGRVAAYALDIEVFRGTMYVREATHRLKFTPKGLPYRLCDMIWNFALFRKDMLAEHRWNDRLKVGEHCPYFHQVKLGSRWRVAACTASRIFHVPEPRPKNYLAYRQRAEGLFRSYLAEQGITQYHRVLPYHFEDDEHDKPCMIVLGVGHSGTTVLAKMLHRLGWNAADADEEFGESVSVRRLNRTIEETGRLTVEYELLAAAVSRFDMERYHAGSQRTSDELLEPGTSLEMDSTFAVPPMYMHGMSSDVNLEQEWASAALEDGSLSMPSAKCAPSYFTEPKPSRKTSAAEGWDGSMMSWFDP